VRSSPFPATRCGIASDIAALCATFSALVAAAESNPLVLEGVAFMLILASETLYGRRGFGRPKPA